MDRFLFRISMGYPDRKYEQKILNRHRSGEPVENLTPVCSIAELEAIKADVQSVVIDEAIGTYIMDIVEETRNVSSLNVGASTRGALLWYRAIQAKAFIEGRKYAVTDDAKQLAVKVLAHRVKPKGAMGALNRDEMESIINEIVSSVATPN
jgi:MoxR-like ATPase